MKQMVAVLGVCEKEVPAAFLWLLWEAKLNDRSFDTVVMLTKGAAKHQDVLMSAAGPNITFATLDDEQERGYPGSASHLFVKSLEFCEKNYKDHPVLWLEVDAIPLDHGWKRLIRAEYNDCDTPFMGHLELTHSTPHMAGVGVYPADWRQRCPEIMDVLTAPDHPAFGPGCGQPWDMWCGKYILPQASQSAHIQQVWKCPSFTDENMGIINPTTVLFHQSKDGSLIRQLWRQYTH
ncbi:MAG TPA: hypothetical protein PLZ24_14670 [Flavobacteriales bacterium]|nr:hypothetical protein [Flavobacteriales bacterium]